mmetsp:Transcript_34593/g.111068  ORF Transcript_34593/g.111068 Transcript_34593/m.111068 type:complete len:164 (-) Transcript_34593:49-540(-)
MFSDHPTSGPYAPPCSARCFEGVARGTMIGVAWTVAHGPESSPGATARTLAGTMTRNCFGFASFLGIYSFVSCTTERIRQRDDVFNYIVGGASVRLSVFVCWGDRPPRFFFEPRRRAPSRRSSRRPSGMSRRPPSSRGSSAASFTSSFDRPPATTSAGTSTCS